MGYVFRKNKNVFWSALVCVLAIVLSIFLLNTLLGLVVFYFDSTQSIYWHFLSPYFVAALVIVMALSVLFEFYIFGWAVIRLPSIFVPAV